jgi:hypothetical protein
MLWVLRHLRWGLLAVIENWMRVAEAYFGYFVYGKVGPMARRSDGVFGVVSDMLYNIA